MLLAQAPGLVHRSDADADVLGDELRVERVHIVAEDVDPTFHDDVAGVPEKDQGRLFERELPPLQST